MHFPFLVFSGSDSGASDFGQDLQTRRIPGDHQNALPARRCYRRQVRQVQSEPQGGRRQGQYQAEQAISGQIICSDSVQSVKTNLRSESAMC